MSAQQVHRRQRFQRRHITAASHDHIRLAAAIIACPLPDADPGGAVLYGLVHIKPLGSRLFTGNNNIHIIAATETVIRHRKQTVGVRREIYAHDLGFLVYNVIDEARILMAKTVMILAPHVRGEQIVKRGDGPAPRDVVAYL